MLIMNLQKLQQEHIVINEENNTGYDEVNEHSTTVKFETKIIKSNLYDYSDSYILVTGNITAVGGKSSFKYKSIFFKPLTADDNGIFKIVKMAVPLDYLSNFWRSLEMPLINCKIHHELNWTKDCVMSTIANRTSKITSTKLYVPIVTLSSTDNVKRVKLLEEGLKRPVYWNENQTKIKTRDLDDNNLTRFLLDDSFQGVRRLFVLAFNNNTVDNPKNLISNSNKRVERDSHTKYFLSRLNVTNYNVVIDGRNFYDQPINDLVKQ